MRYHPKSIVGYCYLCKSWLGKDQADEGNEFSSLAHDQMGKILSKLPSFNSSDKWEIHHNRVEIQARFQYLKTINELLLLEEDLKDRLAQVDSSIASARSRDIISTSANI